MIAANTKRNFPAVRAKISLKGYTLLLLFCILATTTSSQTNKAYTLWYDKPATTWNEALPIGNGRLAAMIYGGSLVEQLQLNEETVWAGEPGNNVPANAYDSIVRIRQLIFDGKYKEAQDLSNKTFPRSAPPGINYGMCYQPVGNLFIRFPGHEQVESYTRDLDIQQAIASVQYQFNNTSFKREIFASLSDGVIIVRLTASKAGSITCTLGVNSAHVTHQVKATGNQLVLTGTGGDKDNKKGKILFESQVQVKTEGGKLASTDTTLQITGANAATIYISIGTNYINYNDVSGNPSAKASKFLTAALAKPYNTAKAEHIKKYRSYFDRVTLNLGNTDQSKKPTNTRVEEFNTNSDPQLVALYFQFGRYLMIAGSQPGTQPTNLQGKWNDRMNPPWDSKYTININTEMNYWPAEVTNLSELHQPLFGMLKDLSVTGRQSAASMYHARGWVVHHNTDLWRISGPVDGGFYGMWPMGGAWLSQHMWYHYLFTGDTRFLQEVYPILKGVAMFYVDVLQEEPVHKWLVVTPSMSPENSYQSGVSISAGTTMDNQIVFDVFSNIIKASSVLKTGKTFADTVRSMIQRLPPMQIGQHGQLQEWLQDWDKPTDKHRHISHLYGLYPGNQVSPYRHPELFNAAKTSLLYRGDKSTGWSMGWKVNWWARLLDGNRAYKLISDQLSPVPVNVKAENGGTYPNLFDAHPPFQIDGNFGCTSGIAEMLVQSHDGAIHILPALPDAWPSGSVTGLVTRGGFVVDMNWLNGTINTVKLQSKLGGVCRIRSFTELQTNSAVKPVADGAANPNPFFAVADIKKPLVSEKAKPEPVQLKKVYEYDIITKPGGVYMLKAK